MATYAPISTLTNLLVGDAGISGAPPTPTLVGGLPISAFEFQSTTRAVALPRMTTAQVAAIATPADGMIAYNSDLNDLVVRKNGVFTQSNPLTGIQYATVTLTSAQVNSMFANGVALLAAPGAGLGYVVHGFSLNLIRVAASFTGGGNVYLEYGAAGAGTAITGTIAAGAITAGANTNGYAAGSFAAVSSTNQPISITNATGAFANGGTSTVVVQIWYSVVASS